MEAGSQTMHLPNVKYVPKHHNYSAHSILGMDSPPSLFEYNSGNQKTRSTPAREMDLAPRPHTEMGTQAHSVHLHGTPNFLEPPSHPHAQRPIHALTDQGESLCYVIERGNGEYTRLIPADMLPPLPQVPAREPRQEGMIVLPVVRNEGQLKAFLRLKDHQQTNEMGNEGVQKSIDRIITTSPPSQRRGKIYCDKWVHEGVCAFTQQGCKFRHEMPFDENVQRSLGLFQGFPAWWKKRTEEMNVCRSSSSGSNTAYASPSSSDARGNALKQDAERREFPLRPLHGSTSIRPAESLELSGCQTPGSSQWMRSGIVPFVRGPMRATHHRSSTMSSWCSMGVENAGLRGNGPEYYGKRGNVGDRVS